MRLTATVLILIGSPLKTMRSPGSQENEEAAVLVLTLPQVCCGVWEDALDFMYGSSFKADDHTAIPLLYIAQHLKIRELYKCAGGFVAEALSPRSAPAFLVSADRLGLNTVAEASAAMVAESFDTYCSVAGQMETVFNPMPLPMLAHILAHPDMAGSPANVSHCITSYLRYTEGSATLGSRQFDLLTETMVSVAQEDALYLWGRAAYIQHARVEALCLEVSMLRGKLGGWVARVRLSCCYALVLLSLALTHSHLGWPGASSHLCPASPFRPGPCSCPEPVGSFIAARPRLSRGRCRLCDCRSLPHRSRPRRESVGRGRPPHRGPVVVDRPLLPAWGLDAC